MPNPPSQTLSNHVRVDPLFHFFVLPVFAISWILSVIQAVRYLSFAWLWTVVLLTALIVLAFKTRLNALKVQDRVIRLEERLRLTALLPASEHSQVSKLTESQLIALRFAPDEEIPGLMRRALSENLSSVEIKKSIQSWRPDYWRV